MTCPARLWRAKTRWRTEQLTVVSPSRWLADLARSSVVFGDCRIEQITTGIDIDLFSPRPSVDARARRLGLPLDRTLILFGANNGIRNPKKGFSLLLDALQRMKALGKTAGVDLVIFGQEQQPSPSTSFPLPVHALGAIYDEPTKALLVQRRRHLRHAGRLKKICRTRSSRPWRAVRRLRPSMSGAGRESSSRTRSTAIWPHPATVPIFAGVSCSSSIMRPKGGERSRSARSFITAHHDGRKIASRYISLYAELLAGRDDNAGGLTACTSR